VHVLDDDRAAPLGGRPANTLAERDAHAGRLSLERTQDELATLI
jgi:hypothetical protein